MHLKPADAPGPPEQGRQAIMRVTGGTIRGRRLAAPKGDSQLIRPTSDRVREAIFNILGQRTRGSFVLDLFAGTGALGIEALSRGADCAVFIDGSRDALRLIHTNLTTCFSRPRAFLLQLRLPHRDLLSTLSRKLHTPPQFDLIFMDPPYGQGLVEPVLQLVEETKILAPGGLVIVEEHRRTKLPEFSCGLQLTDQRQYGETGVWMYAAALDPIIDENEYHPAATSAQRTGD